MSSLESVNPNADTSKLAFHMNVKASTGLAYVWPLLISRLCVS